MLEPAQMLQKMGLTIYATEALRFLRENVEAITVHHPSEPEKPQALELLHKREVDLVVNMPKELHGHGAWQRSRDAARRLT